MSPVAFLQRPMRWLEAISRYGGTTSGGPNFAYELCARKIEPGGAARGSTCRRWRVAFNGAEPVRAATLERFAAAFAPGGFRAEAFYPCYGLAEATLFVTGAAASRRWSAAPAGLERTGGREPAGARGGLRPASCWRGQEVAIVDPETARRLPAASGGGDLGGRPERRAGLLGAAGGDGARLSAPS